VPTEPNANEPNRVAESVKIMGLNHCVITSVTRDDLPDGGAQHWHDTVKEVKKQNPKTKVEVLIPDFNGNTEQIDTVLKSNPDIVAHNLETVKRLTPAIRSRATYENSLKVIGYVAKNGYLSKSGIMVGLGESSQEVVQVMDDLIEVGCKAITIGQYLQPRNENVPVSEYVTPEVFEKYKVLAWQKGFKFVESGPLVRSSYHAEESFKQGASNQKLTK